MFGYGAICIAARAPKSPWFSRGLDGIGPRCLRHVKSARVVTKRSFIVHAALTRQSELCWPRNRRPSKRFEWEKTMHRRQALKAFAGLALCPLCTANTFSAESHHWTYDGESGPAKWGSLDAANAICSSGSQESPLDITAPISARLPSL